MSSSILFTKEVIHALDVIYEQVYEYWKEEDNYAMEARCCCSQAHADGIAEVLSILKEWRR